MDETSRDEGELDGTCRDKGELVGICRDEGELDGTCRDEESWTGPAETKESWTGPTETKKKLDGTNADSRERSGGADSRGCSGGADSRGRSGGADSRGRSVALTLKEPAQKGRLCHSCGDTDFATGCGTPTSPWMTGWFRLRPGHFPVIHGVVVTMVAPSQNMWRMAASCSSVTAASPHNSLRTPTKERSLRIRARTQAAKLHRRGGEKKPNKTFQKMGKTNEGGGAPLTLFIGRLFCLLSHWYGTRRCGEY